MNIIGIFLIAITSYVTLYKIVLRVMIKHGIKPKIDAKIKKIFGEGCKPCCVHFMCSPVYVICSPVVAFLELCWALALCCGETNSKKV